MEQRRSTMAQIGIRPIDQEQVGEIGHRDPEMGARVILAPMVADRAVGAHHFDRIERALRLVACGQHHHVGFVFHTVSIDDAIGGQVPDRAGYQFHIVARQRLEEPAIAEHALAIWRKSGGNFGGEVLIPAHLLQNIGFQPFANALVFGIERAWLLPGRVLAHLRQKAIRGRPQQQEAIPFVVIGDGGQRPFPSGRHFFENQWIGAHPVW